MEIIQFPRIPDPRGNLSFAQKLPFEIKRCYWLYHLTPGSVRGGHAHKKLDRIFIAIHGLFKVNGIGVFPTCSVFIPADLVDFDHRPIPRKMFEPSRPMRHLHVEQEMPVIVIARLTDQFTYKFQDFSMLFCSQRVVKSNH